MLSRFKRDSSVTHGTQFAALVCHFLIICGGTCTQAFSRHTNSSTAYRRRPTGIWGGPNYCDSDRATLRYKILPGLVLVSFFGLTKTWHRAVDAIQSGDPCLIRQRVHRDTKINFSLTQVGDKNTHHPVEI
jgi:hypothetical protein